MADKHLPLNKLRSMLGNTSNQTEQIVRDITLKTSPPIAQQSLSSACGKKVLIIMRRSLGDVLATSPLINALHAYDPEITIDLLVNGDTCEMGKALKHIRRVLCYKYSWWDKGTVSGVKNELSLLKKITRKYDLAISLTTNERSTIYAIMAAKFSIAVVDSSAKNAWLRKAFLSSTYMFEPNCHIVVNILAAVKSLGIPIKRIDLSAHYSSSTVDRVKNMLKEYGIGEFLIFHPSARYQYKVYPRALRNKLLQYLSGIEIPVIITGGNSIIDSRIGADLPKLANTYNFISKTTLEEVIALTYLSRGYIGMDTFNMHIAAAFNKKIVAIFGPTLPQIWSPWSNSLQTYARNNNIPIQRYGDITLIRAAKKCVSCGLAGCDDRNGRSSCLDEIAPETIFAEVRRRWPE